MLPARSRGATGPRKKIVVDLPPRVLSDSASSAIVNRAATATAARRHPPHRFARADKRPGDVGREDALERPKL
jgi:hypothetical protein